MSVGKIMKAERQKRGLNLKEFSKQIGFIYETAWNMENYRSTVTEKSLDKICDYFRLDKRSMAEINLKSSKVYRDYIRYINKL